MTIADARRNFLPKVSSSCTISRFGRVFSYLRFGSANADNIPPSTLLCTEGPTGRWPKGHVPGHLQRHASSGILRLV